MDIDVIVERKSFDVELEIGNPVVEVKAPDHYNGPFDIFPSDEDQIIPVKEKMPVEDICVKGAEGSLEITTNGTYSVIGKKNVAVDVPQPSGSMTITENGTYDVTDYESAVVDIPVSEWSAPTFIYEGDFESATNTFAVTGLPNGEPFAFDRIVIELSNALQGQNVNKRTYWRSDLPMTGNPEQMIFDNGSQYWQGNTYSAISTMTIEDDTYISVSTIKEISKVSTSPFFLRKEHGGYDKITAYGWWSWNCPAGAHIKITGYNRTS